MNLGEMTEDVLVRLRSDDTYFTASDIQAALNEGLQELSEVSRWDEKHVEVRYNKNHIYYDLRTVLNQADIGMRIDEFSATPHGVGYGGLDDAQRERFALFGFTGGLSAGDTFLQPTRCFNPQVNRWLIPSDVMDLDLNTYRMWEQITSNEPQRMFMRGLWWLGLFPKPTYDFDGTRGYVTLYYRAIPRPMVGDGATPDFPEEFHLGLVYYALYDLKCQEGEVTLALGWWKQYVELQEAFRLYVNNRLDLSSYPGFRG